MASRFKKPAYVRTQAPLGQQGRVRLTGLSEYVQKLGELGEGMVDRGCVVALARGSDLMRDAVKRQAPVLEKPDRRRLPGTLRNSIQAMRVRTTQYAVTFVVGIKLLSRGAVSRFKRKTGRGGNENPSDPFYGTVLEYGKTQRTRHPFLLPGFQASSQEALSVAFGSLQQFTDSEIRRLGAK